MKLLLLSTLLFTLNCQSIRPPRSDWHMVVTRPKSIPSPEIKTKPYEFEDESVYISVGPYIWFNRLDLETPSNNDYTFTSNNDFTFILYNKTNESIIIDFDYTSFVGTNGYVQPFHHVTDKPEKNNLVQIPPYSQYVGTLVVTSLSPLRKTAYKKRYLGETVYFRDVRMSFPMLLGEQKKNYVLDVMFYFRDEKSSGRDDTYPVFLSRDPIRDIKD